MEEAKDVTPESVTTESTTETAVNTGGEKLQTETTEAMAKQPEYAPNYKFSVMDKEHEVDEWMRPWIKDLDTEKKVKDLYTKAYGLDYTKEREKTLNEELGNYKTNYTSLYSDVEEAMTFKNKGDLDSFFKKVGLENDVIYDWILAKINRQNLPPEQKQVYERLEAKERAESEQARQLEHLSKQYQSMAEKSREMEVDFGLNNPEVKDIVSSYDAANGHGAFKRFVAEVGVSHFHLTGEDLPAEKAISTVIKRIGSGFSHASKAQTTQPQNTEKQLPVIPNISGRNISPTKKSPRSINDLKKLAEEVTGQL